MMRSTTLKQAYLGFQFPACFTEFAELLEQLRNKHGIELSGSALNLTPAAAFAPSSADPWLDSRYPQDPPEFFTMLHGGSDGLHWGYYAEDENAPSIMVASYYHREPLHFSVDGLNLHEALRGHLETCWADLSDYAELEGRGPYEKSFAELNQIRECLQQYYTGDRPEQGRDYLFAYSFTSRPGIAQRNGIDITSDPAHYLPLALAAAFDDPAFQPSPAQVQQCLRAAYDKLLGGYPLAALKLGRDLWCYETYREESIWILEKTYRSMGRPRALGFLQRIKAEAKV